MLTVTAGKKRSIDVFHAVLLLKVHFTVLMQKILPCVLVDISFLNTVMTEQLMPRVKKMDFCPFFLTMGRCKPSKLSKGQLQPNLISWGVTHTIVKVSKTTTKQTLVHFGPELEQSSCST